MAGDLDGTEVAVLATDGVEQVELERPWQAREEAGAEPVLVSLEGGTITAYQHVDEGDRKKVDATVGTADPDDYAALVLPGGVVNGDLLRADADAVAFVTAFSEAGRPVAAVCHAPWVLAEADVVRGRRMTSWPSLRTDLRNGRRAVGGRGGRRRRQPGDQPRPRRPRRLLRGTRRAVRPGRRGRHRRRRVGPVAGRLRWRRATRRPGRW